MSAERGMTEWTANGVDYIINDPNIAEEFDPTKAYHVRDHVYYQGNLYVFVAEHAAGAWNTSHVLLFKVGTELANLWNANDTEATLRAAADNDLKSALSYKTVTDWDDLQPLSSTVFERVYGVSQGTNISHIPIDTTTNVSFVGYSEGVSGYCTQIVSIIYPTTLMPNKSFKRTCLNGTWTAWETIAYKSDVFGNLFLLPEWKYTALISQSNGTLSNHNDYLASDFIEIPDDLVEQKLTYIAKVPGNGCSIAFYSDDSDGTFLNYDRGSSNDPKTITIPSTAKYIRVGVKETEKGYVFVSFPVRNAQGNIYTELVNEKNKNANADSDVKQMMQYIANSAVTVGSVEQGGYNSRGIKATDDNHIRTTNLIPVYPGMQLSFVVGTNIKKVKYYWYDENKDYLTSSNELSGNQSYTVPNGRYYVRFTFAKSDDTAVEPTDYDANLILSTDTYGLLIEENSVWGV